MDDAAILLIVAVVVVICLIIMWVLSSEMIKVYNAKNDRTWAMLGYDNRDEASRLLGELYADVLKLFRHLRKKYHVSITDEDAAQSESYQFVIRERNLVHRKITALLKEFDPDELYENYPKFRSGTSYTIAKGKRMHVCLRQVPDYNKLVEHDVALFVILHELAHIANYDGWGHGQDFWEIFKLILYEAALIGIYKPVDYSKQKAPYCGMDISHQPLFDDNLRSLWAVKN